MSEYDDFDFIEHYGEDENVVHEDQLEENNLNIFLDKGLFKKITNRIPKTRFSRPM